MWLPLLCSLGGRGAPLQLLTPNPRGSPHCSLLPELSMLVRLPTGQD